MDLVKRLKKFSSKRVKAQWSGAKLQSTLALYTLAAVVLAVTIQNDMSLRGVLMFNKPHPNKKYLSFTEFYPFYLTEHSDPTNKLLHFIGTTLVTVVSLMYSPRTIASALLVMPIGVCAFYANVSAPRGVF